ncbi:zeta toxin family protein [Streptomyces coeruleorubidus]|uniref:zeta toxin family protein n=1 Tax=Streptomyces coeruleorubidus TaxID=116188 RepID=UPI003790E5A3
MTRSGVCSKTAWAHCLRLAAGTITPEAEQEMTAIFETLTSPMSPRPPFCVLMAGLPGSGKTTLSRTLTDRGFVRLCRMRSRVPEPMGEARHTQEWPG